MALADQWYNSGTFWAAAGTIAVLVSGAIATYLAIRQEQDGRLDCVISVTPLLQGIAQETSGDFKITWDGAELKDPHIVEINLFNNGRTDIRGDNFEQELQFHVDAKIITILRTDSGPASSKFDANVVEDHLVKVSRGLIHEKDAVKITLLTVGSDPKVTSSAVPLSKVKFRILAPEKPNRRWSTKVRLAGSLTAAAGITGLVMIGIVIGHNSSPSTNPPVTDRSTSLPIAPSEAITLIQKAKEDLNSSNQSVQLNGISAMRRIINTWPIEQPTAVEEIAQFVHRVSPAGSNDQPVKKTVQAALDDLIERNPADDGKAVIDFTSTNLTDANLAGLDLDGATLVNTDFSDADLGNASLRNANLNYAFVGGADLAGTNLYGANLTNASFYSTILCRRAQPTEPQRGYNCSATG